MSISDADRYERRNRRYATLRASTHKFTTNPKVLVHDLDNLSDDQFIAFVEAAEKSDNQQAKAMTHKDDLSPVPMSRRLRMLQQHYAPAVAADMEGTLAGLTDADFERFIGDIARITGASTTKAVEALTPQPIPRATSLPAPMAATPRRIVCEGDPPPTPAADELRVDDDDKPTPDERVVRAEVRDFLGCLFGLDETAEPLPDDKSPPPEGKPSRPTPTEDAPGRVLGIDETEQLRAEIIDHMGDLFCIPDP